MAKIKYKKQFRLYDIYRCAVTKEMSHIEGIQAYDVNSDASVVRVKYADTIGPVSIFYCAKNEDELKEVVRTINAKLGNCYKPGPKKLTHVPASLGARRLRRR